MNANVRKYLDAIQWNAHILIFIQRNSESWRLRIERSFTKIEAIHNEDSEYQERISGFDDKCGESIRNLGKLAVVERFM